MENNRPTGRKRKVIGQGSDIHKGEQVNTGGPAGRKDGYAGRRPGSGTTSPIGDNQQDSGSGGSFLRTTRGKGSIGGIILIVILLFLAWKFGLFKSCSLPDLSGTQQSMMDGSFSNGGTVLNSSDMQKDNRGQLNRNVASGSRAKLTSIKGNNQDKVLILVYMCGTDLESKYGMATNDLREMAAANVNNPNFEIIVYTGGCNQWKTSAIKNHQVYKVTAGGIQLLSNNAGSGSMTDPKTLTNFIKKYANGTNASGSEPNRKCLIFWDHGGGSVTGYGYDETKPNTGSMSLQGINSALKSAGEKFDFIGFDACLMATIENALMLEPYADYLIASEETEPGVGWYYTNWVKAFANNTSMDTLDVGKMIVDDFVAECNRSCQGQKTTLSVVDLAELANTVGPKFKEFSNATSELIKSDYQTVANARSNTREFATTSRIDQVDLVHLAINLNTQESLALADAILGAVKYNNTSSNMPYSYGLSVFFPYRKSSMVDSAVATYKAIGLDSSYSRCIQQFAAMSVAGQAAGSSASTGSVGSASPSSILSGSSGSGLLSSGGITDLLGGGDILSSLLGGGGDFFGRSIGEIGGAADYIAAHQFDSSKLKWTKSGSNYVIALENDQWDLVRGLLLNVFVDDGEGYIDLGMDNIFSFTDRGELIGSYDKCWLGIDGQAVAYYYMDEIIDGDTITYTGYVPCQITHSAVDFPAVQLYDESGNPIDAAAANGGEVTVRANLILVGTQIGDDINWKIAGAIYDYEKDDAASAKCMTEIPVGAKIDLFCDHYSYSGEYLGTYKFGEQFTYTGNNVVGDYEFTIDNYTAFYMFTDIYGMEYWTEAIPHD